MKNGKEKIPWWLKIIAKIILARLPISYNFWKRVGLFEHGDMNQSERALNNFLEHAHTANVLTIENNIPCLKNKNSSYTVLELGAGDSLFTAIISKSLGASKTWLVDAGSFATTSIPLYFDLINYLKVRGFKTPIISLTQPFEELLEKCQAEYLINGVHSLSQIPSKSVDYSFSNAVLEHIPREDFTLLLSEIFRVMKPDGVSVHRVDLRDHLGGQLNNLRFTNTTWEGKLFRKSGFYTNRIRFGEMINFFDKAGFHCQLTNVIRWNNLPTKRSKLDKMFQNLPDDDLLVSCFDIVLRLKV